ADLEAAEPDAPAEVRLLEVREKFSVEHPRFPKHTPPQQEGGALRGEDLVGLGVRRLRLERTAVHEEAGRREERARGVEARGVVEQEELRLARAPRRMLVEGRDDRVQPAR